MRLVLAVAGLLMGAVPVSAQYIPRPPAPIGAGSAQDAAEIVQTMGFDPIGPALRSGPYHVQRARDGYGRVVRVTVDARRSQIMAVERDGVSTPYAGRGNYRRPYPGYAAVPYDDDIAPPGSITGARPYPQATLPPPRSASVTPNVVPAPHVAAPPKPSAPKTAAAPTPRKRPASAPQEAAGSVESVSPPQNAAPAPAPVPAQQTPPVTPLE